MSRTLSPLLLIVALVAVAVSAQADVVPLPPRTPSLDHLVVRGGDAPSYGIAAGKGRATIFYDARVGSPDAAMTLLVLEPGAAVPRHVHRDSVEMLYLLEGKAEMVVRDRLVTIGAGDAVRIPKGVEHEARVVGDQPLRALQVYTPAGPEQRFIPKP